MKEGAQQRDEWQAYPILRQLKYFRQFGMQNKALLMAVIPYNVVYLRKKKFTKGRVTFFVLINARSYAGVVGRNYVVKSPIVKVPNKMVPMSFTSTRSLWKMLSLSTCLQELITVLKGLLMQNYNFLNRSSGEIVTQKFKNLQQVEDFLQKNERFELVEEDLQNLPVRGTRQLS